MRRQSGVLLFEGLCPKREPQVSISLNHFSNKTEQVLSGPGMQCSQSLSFLDLRSQLQAAL